MKPAIYEPVEEVENALHALAREHERIEYLDDAARSVQGAADVVLQHYEAGLHFYPSYKLSVAYRDPR